MMHCTDAPDRPFRQTTRRLMATAGLFSALWFTTACGQSKATAPESPAAPVATGDPIVLADISEDPAKKIARFQPVADYLAANLDEFDVGVGEVKIAPDLATMVEWMKAGEVDLYFDSLFPAMLVSNEAGAEPILRRWKDGDADYYTIFFTRADSDIQTLEDLSGQMLGMQEESSTSGYFLPMTHLLEAGLNPVEKPAENAAVKTDEVGYVFTGDDENTVQWVVSGKVAVGAVDNQSFSEIPVDAQTEIRILAKTEKVARQVAMVPESMDPEMQVALTDLLLELDDTPEGRQLLDEFKHTKKFDEFPEGSGLERMRQLYQVFQNQVSP